ncbi:MAG: autotransporter-associated beta strand repeat-containing protein [Akkermansiaceae bacterium]|nr:autotransporter-associated beta strand repeat-containing protein [Akkermansiaceae bacterium]
MNITRICNPLRVALKPSARALAVVVGLVAGSVQAVTTTSTYDLGTSLAATTIESGVPGLLRWIAKGALPPGSILRSVSVDAQIETAPGDSFASDICAYIDPSPETAGTAALLQVGGSAAIGTAPLTLSWANGGAGPPATVIDTKTAATWSDLGDVDLSTVQLSVGNDYSSASWSGTITVEYDVPEDAAILTFGPGAVVGPLVGNAATIAWTVPSETDVTTLTPTFTLSTGTCDRDSGGTYDFTNPVVYTVTDGPTVNTYTVTVTAATTIVWNLGSGGAWDTTTENWLEQVSGDPALFANGDQVLFDNSAGGTIVIDPDMSPLSTTVSAASGTYTFTGGPIATGSLTKTGGGTLQLNVTPANFSSIAVTGGTLYLFAAESGFAPDAAPFTMPDTTVESGAALEGWRAHATGGTLTLNGGRYWEYNGWDDGGWWGPIYLAADSYFGKSDGWCYAQTLGGEISGPGGFTYDSYGNQQDHPLTLSVANSYTGPTIVNSGMVVCKDPSALGNGGALSISAGAKVKLDYAGEHNVASLTLGGVPQPGGTHGSSTSGADYPNDTYFAAGSTGTVMVPASSEKNMLTFTFGALGAATIGDTTITLEVPFGTDRTNLAPTYTVSAEATGSPPSGTARNFTSAQTYTVTAQDLSTKNYTVTVTEAVLPNIFTWTTATSGNWSVPANWTNEESIDTAPLAGGRKSYTLNFNTAGTYTATNNLAAGFQLNLLNLGSAVTLAGNRLAFVANDATLPTINQNSGSQVTVSNDMELGSDTTFGGPGNGQVNFTGVITGAGSLTKNGTGVLTINKAILNDNSFTGGTIINSGQLRMNLQATLGTGPITLNGGTIFLWRFYPTNALIVNGGTLLSENGFGNTWNGPVTLNTNLNCDVYYPLTITGNISGTGGLTKNIGVYNPILTLSGTNTYTGPTSVTAGTLQCNSPDAVASGDLGITGGVVNLNYAGTKNIASLTLGGVAKTDPGTYGSVASLADFQDDTYFAGTGTVTVGGGSGCAGWAGAYAGGPTPGED